MQQLTQTLKDGRMENPDRKAKMGAASRSFYLEKFTEAKMVEKLRDCFDTCIGIPKESQLSKPPKSTVAPRNTFKQLLKRLLLFFSVEFFNSVVLLMKKTRTYKFDPSKFNGLNIGSSTICPPNWLGISGGITIFFINLPKALLWILFPLSSRSKRQTWTEFKKSIKALNVVHHDLCFGIPFKNESIPNIFSSHFFEHLTDETAVFIANECFRVLKPGGMIRIIVPSLQNEATRMKKALEDYAVGNPDGLQSFSTEEYQAHTDPYGHHRYMYDYNLMRNLLNNAGFNPISEKQLGQGDFPDLEELETRGGLVVEACKPS